MVETIGVKNTLIKAAILVLAIKETWLLLGIPAVENALVSFLTVGAIPGTNKTLTPDEVYKLVVALVVIIGVLIFRKDIVRLFQKAKASQSEEQTASSAMPIPHPLAPIAVITPDKADKSEEVPRKQHVWAWRLQGVWLLVRIQTIRFVLVTKLAALQYAKLLAGYSMNAKQFLVRASIAAAKKTAIAAVAFWRAIEPYLRRFDRWLERKLHQYDQTATLLALGNEMTSTLRKWREESKTLMRESDSRK
jgi:hypothetical protein